MRGKIVKGIAGFYYVQCEESGPVYACKARGLFREQGIKPVVGDNVVFSVTDEKDLEGNVEEILPRKNTLIRPLSANVDQALVLFAAADPDPNLNLLDRFLVNMEIAEIPPVICFNKTDLVTDSRIAALRAVYEPAGYPVVFISVKLLGGLEKIKELLHGRTTILAGPSGAGKSSLINALCPEAALTTGELSTKIRRGKNTTRHTELIYVKPDIFLCDTPGFSSLAVEGIDERHVKYCFPEFDTFKGPCRFGEDCMHIGEPDCGVKQAVTKGQIAESRYDNYRLFVDEIKSRKKY